MQRDLIYLLCILLGFGIFFQLKFNREPSEIINTAQNNVKTVADNEIKSENFDVNVRRDINSDPYVVQVNLPVELSGKTRDEVYEIRRHYVRTSIFDADNYQPSNQVYGQIVDGKPWYGQSICWEDFDGEKRASITGPSEESRYINNPTVLVAIEFPFGFTEATDYEFCNSPVNRMIPTYISYSKSKNEITVKYDSLPHKAKDQYYYQFNGQNAVDLGYKYMYVDMLRSTFKPDFSDKENNPSTSIQEFKNFIHVGYSCNRDGGCNNGSPRQPNLEFNYGKRDGAGEIYIKLWKNKPFTVMQKPDIAERIIIER